MFARESLQHFTEAFFLFNSIGCRVNLAFFEPRNFRYKSCGYMRRQVVDIKIQRVITEYRAETLKL
jgi:hypothetical protein